MSQFLHDWLPPWSSFNSLGRSRVVKSSYLWVALVPVLAKMLSAINRDFRLTIFSPKIHIVLGVPFTWELLYYSAVLFALATLGYTVACPEIVKKYDKYSDFEVEGKGSEQLVAYALGVTGDRTRRIGRFRIADLQLLRFVRDYCGRRQLDPDNLAQLEDSKEFFMADRMNVERPSTNAAFWFIRSQADRYATLPRAVVGVLYGAGFTFFAWVMIQNFWFVFSQHLLK